MNYFGLLLNLYKLKRNTTKSREQIKNLQEQKLRKIIKYAYNNSEYYRRIFSNKGITEKQLDKMPLSEFPTIDKAVLIENFESLVTVSDVSQNELREFDNAENKDKKLFKGKYHIVHSSGSTGKPAYFVYDETAWDYMLCGMIRAALWNMSMFQIIKYLVKIPKIMYIAATDGRYGGAMAVGDGIEGVNGNQLFLDVNMPLNEWKKKTEEFKPNMIVGYPSAIKILGELAESGKINVDVFRVVSCGEPLSVNLRQYFERVFNADVINYYGASESLVLGVESDIEGMYLFDDMNYIETDGKNMYVTSLYNYAQPLIRYKITDRIKLKNENIGTYPFTMAESISGRDEDILWFEDNYGKKEFLHPLAIEGFCIEGLLDYQFRQTGLKSFEMLAEISYESAKPIIKERMLKQMRKILKEKQLEYVDFNVRFVDAILPDKVTGKKKLIVKQEDFL
jgi:phenylacetate-CoA ligase